MMMMMMMSSSKKCMMRSKVFDRGVGVCAFVSGGGQGARFLYLLATMV